eukprot:gene3476-6920_t
MNNAEEILQLIRSLFSKYDVRCTFKPLDDDQDDNDVFDSKTTHIVGPHRVFEMLQILLPLSFDVSKRIKLHFSSPIEYSRSSLRMLPIVDSALYYETDQYPDPEQQNMSMRISRGTCRGHLLDCIRNSRHITMRNIVKWCLQILSSIIHLHKSLIAGVSITAADFQLVSDEIMMRSIVHYKSLDGKSDSENDMNRDMFDKVLKAYQPEASYGTVHVRDTDPRYETVRSEYSRYCEAMHSDYRHIGVIAIQLLLKRALLPKELATVLSEDFDLSSFQDVVATSHLAPAIQELLSLCMNRFMPPRVIHLEYGNDDNNNSNLIELLSPPFHNAGIIVVKLGELLDTLGGEFIPYGIPSSPNLKDGLKLQSQLQLQELSSVKLLAVTAGRDAAKKRLWLNRKQIEFDLLPEHDQQRVLRRQRARNRSRDNMKMRAAAIQAALFHNWIDSERRKWIHIAIFQFLFSSKKLIKFPLNVDKSIIARAHLALDTVGRIETVILPTYTKTVNTHQSTKKEPTVLELETDKINSFKAFAHHISALFSERCTSLELGNWLRKTQKDTHDKLQSNSLSRVLPAAQYNILREKNECTLLSKNRVLFATVFEFSATIGLVSESWTTDAVHCVTSALLLAFDRDKPHRIQGENFAAARIQGLLRRTRIRILVQRVWRDADRLYQEEEALACQLSLALAQQQRHQQHPSSLSYSQSLSSRSLQSLTSNISEERLSLSLSLSPSPSLKESQSRSTTAAASGLKNNMKSPLPLPLVPGPGSRNTTSLSQLKKNSVIGPTPSASASASASQPQRQHGIFSMANTSPSPSPSLTALIPSVSTPSSHNTIPMEICETMNTTTHANHEAPKKSSVKLIHSTAHGLEFLVKLCFTEYGSLMKEGFRVRAVLTIPPHRHTELATKAPPRVMNRVVVLGQKNVMTSASYADSNARQEAVNVNVEESQRAPVRELGEGMITIVIDGTQVGMSLPLPSGQECAINHAWEDNDNGDDDDGSVSSIGSGSSVGMFVGGGKMGGGGGGGCSRRSSLTSAPSSALSLLPVVKLSGTGLAPRGPAIPFSTDKYEASRTMTRKQWKNEVDRACELSSGTKSILTAKVVHDSEGECDSSTTSGFSEPIHKQLSTYWNGVIQKRVLRIALPNMFPHCSYTVSVVAHSVIFLDENLASQLNIGGCVGVGGDNMTNAKRRSILSQSRSDTISIGSARGGTLEAVPDRPFHLRADHISYDNSDPSHSSFSSPSYSPSYSPRNDTSLRVIPSRNYKREMVTTTSAGIGTDHLYDNEYDHVPSSTTITSSRITGVTLMWDCPVSNGHPVTEFEIQKRYTPTASGGSTGGGGGGGGGGIKWRYLANTTDVGYTDVIQHDGGVVEYRVRARNRLGWSRCSDIYSITLAFNRVGSSATSNCKNTLDMTTGTTDTGTCISGGDYNRHATSVRLPSLLVVVPPLPQVSLEDTYRDLLCVSPSTTAASLFSDPDTIFPRHKPSNNNDNNHDEDSDAIVTHSDNDESMNRSGCTGRLLNTSVDKQLSHNDHNHDHDHDPSSSCEDMLDNWLGRLSEVCPLDKQPVLLDTRHIQTQTHNSNPLSTLSLEDGIKAGMGKPREHGRGLFGGGVTAHTATSSSRMTSLKAHSSQGRKDNLTSVEDLKTLLQSTGGGSPSMSKTQTRRHTDR